MLFERQRVLLPLLEALGGQVSPTDFQKLLFLYTRKQETGEGEASVNEPPWPGKP